MEGYSVTDKVEGFKDKVKLPRRHGSCPSSAFLVYMFISVKGQSNQREEEGQIDKGASWHPINLRIPN